MIVKGLIVKMYIKISKFKEFWILNKRCVFNVFTIKSKWLSWKAYYNTQIYKLPLKLLLVLLMCKDDTSTIQTHTTLVKIKD